MYKTLKQLSLNTEDLTDLGLSQALDAGEQFSLYLSWMK